jgi:ferric-dicitrate binding protein FerR (iron transport regulator)
MPDRLLSPPPVNRERAAELWVEMIDAGEALLLSGFATRFGADQAEEHFRAWGQQQLVEHDRRLEHLLAELSRRESGHGR